MNYFYIYIGVLLATFTFLGYGSLLINIINKEIFKNNIGYVGLLGLLFSTIISYITIFFTKHGYIHNSIFHLIGLFLFTYLRSIFLPANWTLFINFFDFIYWIINFKKSR